MDFLVDLAGVDLGLAGTVGVDPASVVPDSGDLASAAPALVDTVSVGMVSVGPVSVGPASE